MTPSMLSARQVRRDYRLPRSDGRLWGPAPVRHALRGVDVDIDDGHVVALIGESGSGKSTLVRILLGLDQATSGSVQWDGRDVDAHPRRGRWLREQTGIVLQDPYASLNPRQTVYRIVSEPLRALRREGDHRALVHEVLDRVGLHRWRADQFPHELSGGQRQRVALARAIVHGPRLLVGDEPLSALDVTVRAQVLALLAELHRDTGLALLLVSHDIGLVQHLADDVYVLHDGLVVEQGPATTVLGAPQHPYTRTLLASVPTLAPRTP